MKRRLLLCFAACFALPLSAIAQDAASPSPDFRTASEPDAISPDGQVEVRQYYKEGDSYVYQFWTFDKDKKHPHLLNAGETGTMTEYGASFRFSRDSKWLVRMQKVAAGESTLFLYKRDGATYVPATPKTFGDMAWGFFFTQPEAKNVPYDNLRPETILVRGLDNNYASMGEHWPDSRYIVVGLSSGESGTAGVVGPWHCVYDTQTGTFSIPPDIAKFNQSKMPWK
jgi:hypothetical protein